MFPALERALPLMDPETGSIPIIYLNRKLLWFSDCASASATCNEWVAVTERLAYLAQVPETRWAASLEVPLDPLYGGGLDPDPGMAILKAMGECVERMAGRVRHPQRVPTLKGSARNLHRMGLVPDPQMFRLLSDDQLQDPRNQLCLLDPDRNITWVVASDLRGGFGCVPLSMAILSPALPPHERLAEPFSTGLACHRSLAEAQLSGLCEVVERDAFMGMWLNRLSPPRLDLASCREASPQVAKRLDELAATTFEIFVHDLTTEFGIPVFMAGLTRPERPYTLVSAACHPKASVALEKALLELLMGIVYCMRHGDYPGEYPQEPAFKDVMEHAELYAFRDLRDRLAFLDAADQVPFSPGQEPQGSAEDLLMGAISQMEAHGYRPLFLDMGMEAYEACGFHVAKAMVPGLVPLHNLPWHAPLGCPRLAKFEQVFPRKMQFPEAMNPWHHPFP